MPTEPSDQPVPRSKEVFISYSRKDLAFADQIEAALKARGFEALIDRTDIYAFEDWWKRIEDLIGRADTLIFVLSPDAVRCAERGRVRGFAQQALCADRIPPRRGCGAPGRAGAAQFRLLR